MFILSGISERTDHEKAKRESQGAASAALWPGRGRHHMGQGFVSEAFRGKENPDYHNLIALFKIYRAVSWKMKVRINQVQHRIQQEYGMDVEAFLDSVYMAGMEFDRDLSDKKPCIEAINQSNHLLKLLDGAVDLMRRYHPQGEKYYWVLYYTYLSPHEPENVEEILELLENHYPHIHRATYYRWRQTAFEAVGNILWGYDADRLELLRQFIGKWGTAKSI